jgi:cytidylate kinase
VGPFFCAVAWNSLAKGDYPLERQNMNVITVTREYGAGGYEVARGLAERLGWELLDRELLHRAAALEHLPDAELERLDEKAVSLADRFRLHPPHEHYIHGLREAARQAADKGNVVLVGRGTGQLLAGHPNVFHLRLAADIDWRARRMAQREGWPLERAHGACLEQDRVRARFTRYFFGPDALQPEIYDLIVNTARVALDEVVVCSAALVQSKWPTEALASGSGRRVLTLARELGAGETDFALTLATKLALRIYDRDLLEQEAVRMGVARAELEKIDEQPAGIFQRIRPGNLYHKYFEVLGHLMKDLASHGDVLIVGRGGSRFLRGDPRTFHIRLVAPKLFRLRRVMEHRWLRQEPAEKIIAHSDGERRRFYSDYFGADWSDPLEYHLTVNGGRLGAAATDLAAMVAERYWARSS